ncbi:MAG TPA: hypothetical protein VF152_10160 [Acidimicrobiia bacterium]
MLDDALDELYGVEPSRFTATRNALRDRLREAGDSGAAKEIARARRPTTAAWALNQLAREAPGLVDEVVDRTQELQAAQGRARPGAAGEVRAATARRRDALAAAADAAVAIAARITDNPAPYREPVLATLEAGSVDAAGADALRAGRHVRDTPGPVGFPATGPAVRRSDRPRPAAPAAKAAPEAPRTTDRGRKARAAEERAAEERAELAEAEAEVRAARGQADAAATAATAADERVAQAEADVEHARTNLREAKRVARDAHAELRRRERAAELAVRVFEAGRRRLGSSGR